MSRSINLMKDENNWQPFENRRQYQMLGFHHDTTKLLYVADYKKLPCCPVKPKPDYIWDDVNLSKGSSFKKHEFSTGNEDDQSNFVLFRCHCAGVKVH